jgi:hypothetical protein
MGCGSHQSPIHCFSTTLSLLIKRMAREWNHSAHLAPRLIREEMCVKSKTKTRLRNHFCCGKAMSIAYFCVCVCGWGMLVCACSLTYRTWYAQAPYYLRCLRLHNIFELYLINGSIFGKVTEHKIRVLIFSTTFVWNISYLRRIHRDTVINVKRCSCKVPVIIVGF